MLNFTFNVVFYRLDFMEKEWQHPPVFLTGKSHGQRSLAGYSPWGCKGQAVTNNNFSPKDHVEMLAIRNKSRIKTAVTCSFLGYCVSCL